MKEIEIRKLEQKEVPEALELVWKVFLEYEAPDYTRESAEDCLKQCYEIILRII